MKKILFGSLLVFAPFITLAQEQTAQTWITGVTEFLSSTVITFLLGIAFFMFVVNAVRYFIIGSTNEQGREKAKALTIYSIVGFVFIIIFWGVITLLATATGLSGTNAPTSDYISPGGVAPSNNNTFTPPQTDPLYNI